MEVKIVKDCSTCPFLYREYNVFNGRKPMKWEEDIVSADTADVCVLMFNQQSEVGDDYILRIYNSNEDVDLYPIRPERCPLEEGSNLIIGDFEQ